MPILAVNDTHTKSPHHQVRHTIVLGPNAASILRATARNASMRSRRRKRLTITQFGIGSDGQALSVYLSNASGEAGYGLPMAIQGSLENGALFTGHYNALTRCGYIDVITP